jgi:alkylated DNA repair protein (DNA oxidative demethylase)
VKIVARNLDLFAGNSPAAEELLPEVWLFRRFAEPQSLRPLVDSIVEAAPFRHMHTPGGGRMSVAISNCGALGWVSERKGYRYSPIDPESGRPWPAMPSEFARLAARAAARAGHAAFAPDSCLINRYAVGASMGSHQDRNERDFTQPIVSVSLGLSAQFLWYGERRGGTPRRVLLEEGDVLVWGGRARLGYHGVAKLRAADSDVGDTVDQVRINLTMRRAG